MSDKLEKKSNLPVPSSGKEEVRVDMELVNKVSALEQKVATLKANSNLTDRQIAKACKLSMRKYNKIVAGEGVQEVIKFYQSELLKNDVQISKRQNNEIRNKLYLELQSRFDEPDMEADLPDDASITERKMYLQRFMKYASAKDIMKMFVDHDKIVKEDQNITSGVDDRDDLVKTVFSRAEKRRMIRKKRNAELEKGGVKEEEFYGKVLDRQPDGTFKMSEDEYYQPASQEDFYEVLEEVETVEKVEFLTKGDKKDE
ncbi:MAG: hypothetical protein CL489_10875 [Acidobacteria bacterium]|nr:hypothetical protein [Acidobacteriota bacterium]|tara:strand:+ start:14806 stop:15576 length:771 start_codon:yes stop_codon:yes gene_type:complete